MNIIISKKTIIFSIFLIATSLHTVIIEIKHFQDIKSFINPGAVVILDIDNTLLEPCDPMQIGSDQWFTKLLKEHPNTHDAISHYCAVVLASPMKLVEQTIPDIIKSIQEQTIILGFTMRSLVLAPCTIDYLTHNGIIFQQNLPNKGFMIDSKHQVMLYDDIIFCQGQKNALTLFTVLDACDIYPSSIIMVDDKMDYLIRIEQGCNERSIPFIGLRYGHLDHKVSDFLQ